MVRNTRRQFMGGIVAAAAATAGARAESHPAANPSHGICLALCNHWSYTGIGWQLGIESNVLSVTDAMEVADRSPFIKTCINLDARAYEVMADRFPEVVEKLRRYLAAGKLELIGGTYGQPLGTMFGGEANIRQIVVGLQTIRRVMGYEVSTFLEEEEFTHPQLPQLLHGAGYRYASLAQVDTWGAAGVPRLEVNVFQWKGKDGTTIPSMPKNSAYRIPLSSDAKTLLEAPAFRKLAAASGKPLVITWEEFGWESPEHPAYLDSPAEYRALADRLPVEFVTLKEYMEKYGAQASETVSFEMDDWRKLLTWGLGGDQLRIYDRKVEAVLLAAERFDAIAASLDGKSQCAVLEDAWKHLLISQSHDVSLCEYSRWQGDRMAPVDRAEDYHNFSWGTIGYTHLAKAEEQATPVLDAALTHIASHVNARAEGNGWKVLTVFNPCGWDRSGIAKTGRLYPLPDNTKGIVVKDRSGRAVPSQWIRSETDQPGNVVVAELEFLAKAVPGVGYDTYYVDVVRDEPQPVATDLRIDTSSLTMENEHLKVRIDPLTGAVASVVDKRSGQEMLKTPGGGFPVFNGTPNPAYKPRAVVGNTMFGHKARPIPERYDSSRSQARIDWTEKGPVRATVRAQHSWPLLTFETRVSLSAGMPCVEVTSRVLCEIPPLPDEFTKEGVFPVDIKQGYWLSFIPGFEPVEVIRDYPFAVEKTVKPGFHALTFVDLVGPESGLLVLHPGTQYFRRDNAAISNLIMREWESCFTGEYGWPRYSEYRHVLMPHGANLDNAARLRASAEFSQGLLTVVGAPRDGALGPRKAFVSVTPAGVQLTSLRLTADKQAEVRVVEVNGKTADAQIELDIPMTKVSETNLMGAPLKDVPSTGSRFQTAMSPWRLRTFSLR
jgi:hypothetical protein